MAAKTVEMMASRTECTWAAQLEMTMAAKWVLMKVEMKADLKDWMTAVRKVA